MAERKPAKPAKAAKKVAPRTKGTPAKPPKPRKVAAAPKPKASAKRSVPKAAKRGKAPVRPRAPPTPTTAVWLPAPDPEPQWRPAPDPAPTSAAMAPPARPMVLGQGTGARAFNPATGQWLPAPEFGAVVDPAAYRRGATRSVLLNILLGLDLGLLALNFVLGIVVGIILVFAPDSAAAHKFESSGITSPAALAFEAILMFVLAGVIPFFWVLGTRVRAWEGTKRFLQLRVAGRDWLRGIILVPLMLVAVIALSVVYTCAMEGCSALSESADDQDTGVDALLDNLTWPVAIIVALGAGIGEEILFRGVLRKSLGVWGQAIAFGLAHAGNGYPPQVLFAFGLGVAFGSLAQRGWSLVSLMVAHALYDFILLSLALLYPDLG